MFLDYQQLFNTNKTHAKLLGKIIAKYLTQENEQKEKLIYLIKNKDKCLVIDKKSRKAKTFNVDDYEELHHILTHQYQKMFFHV